MWYSFLMRLHRFYIQTPITEKTFDVTDRDLVHQWRSVFRYNVGSEVVLFDGSGMDFLCIITSLRNQGATLEIVSKKHNKNMPKINLWLCLGIIKKDNFEWATQKATELGVSHIVPILCERTEKKNLSLDRLQKIAVEASEQSGRGDVPLIHPVQTLPDLMSKMPFDMPKEKVVLHPDGEYIGDFLAKQPLEASSGRMTGSLKELAVFIGPEGGFSEAEIRQFTANSIPNISLGPQILRAETAAVAVSSLLLL